MTTKSSLLPEQSNPYAPGRCWRMRSDSGGKVAMCRNSGALYSVSKNGAIFCRMYLCDKCASYMRDRAKYIVTKV